MADLNTNDQVEQALAILDSGDGAGESAAKSPEDQILERLDGGDTAPDQGAGETAPDTTVESVETATPAEGEQPKVVTEPSIEAPASWKAEWKEQFKALPPEAQKIIAERESERERGLTKSQQESAEARKAALAQVEAVQAERKNYVAGLNDLIQSLATTDPVIAEGRKTDWEAEHVKDPLGAPARLIKYQNRERMLAGRVQERNQLVERTRYENYQRGDVALREKLDFWADTGKRSAFQSEFAKYLTEQGYKQEEATSIDDYRAILLGRKAMLYDQLMAQQTKIAATKATPVTGKVVRSQSNDGTGTNVRAEALTKRAMKSGRTDDIVDAVLARL